MNLIKNAIDLANKFDSMGAVREADVVEALVQKALDNSQVPSNEILSLVKEMRDQAAKEIEYGKQNPEEAEEENKEAAKMNSWADKLVKLFGLQEEKKEEPKEESDQD